jgi:hypothetical protein
MTLLVVLGLSSCAATTRPVAAPPLSGGYYVLESDKNLVSFQFFEALPGTMRIVQSYEAKEEIQDESEAAGGDPIDESIDKGPVLSRVATFFYLVSKETGVIEFCPDIPVDQGEHTRAFLPGLPRKGTFIRLGVTGGGDGPVEVPFLRTGESTFSFEGREIPVIVLEGTLGTREDELHYATHAGIIVYARFSGPGGQEEFRLVETNLELVPGGSPAPVTDEEGSPRAPGLEPGDGRS